MNAMDDIHKKILRKFHALCSAAGLTQDEKRALISGYGVESSADIDTHQLIDICAYLDGKVNKLHLSQDKLRKQVMASIGGYLTATGQKSSAEIIKGIACRATGYADFNKIPCERLRNIYCAFVNKQKDIKATNEIVDGMVASIIASAGASKTGKKGLYN